MITPQEIEIDGLAAIPTPDGTGVTVGTSERLARLGAEREERIRNLVEVECCRTWITPITPLPMGRCGICNQVPQPKKD